RGQEGGPAVKPAGGERSGPLSRSGRALQRSAATPAEAGVLQMAVRAAGAAGAQVLVASGSVRPFGGDDTGGHGDDGIAEDHGDAGDGLAGNRQRDEIAVSHRGHGDD